MRFEEFAVCGECRKFGLHCQDTKKCMPIKQKLRPFQGIRFTSDGFDCALPVTIDSHSSCAYECLYCFSDNILGHTNRSKLVGQTSLKQIENIFSGNSNSKMAGKFQKGLKYDRRNKNGFPCAVQLGGLCDPCDSIEQNQGWLLKFIELAIKYKQPVRMSTKGALFQLPAYKEAISKAPHLFWIAFSIITDDDEVLAKVDRLAPNATQRLETMRTLSGLGVNTSLRLRPIMRGITDRNQAYKSLIRKAAEAGAKAVSYEVGFYPQTIPKTSKWKWKLLNEIAQVNYRKIYSQFGKIQACTRPSYLWTENIMHAIKQEAHKYGMSVGISDPVWKQLGDSGCCCGIMPDEPVFGNWERENATHALLEAAKRKDKRIYFKEVLPLWADGVPIQDIVNVGAGEQNIKRIGITWGDSLRNLWNNPTKERSPVNYFQGAVVPTKQKDKDGNLIYKYIGLKRKHRLTDWEV